MAVLRDLLNSKKYYKWTDVHQAAFDNVLHSFKETSLLHYFDLSQRTFIFVDAHVSGLGAVLAQGENIQSAVPIEFVSRSTNKAEKKYPQLDLEAMAVDFALRRFRQYLVGSPSQITIVTDHHPLLSIFNGRKGGSIRTERIKMRHQNIRYKLIYQKGCDNVADFLSRHAKPWETLSKKIREEADDLKNLLYTLRFSPILDAIGIKDIALATATDRSLSKLQNLIRTGESFIPNYEDELGR